MQAIKECISFLNFPQRIINLPRVESPISYIFSLFIFAFVLNIILLSLVSNFVDFESMDNGILALKDSMGFAGMFALAVIAAPVIEEIIFRFPLQNKVVLSFLLIGLDAIIVSIFCQAFGWHNLAIYLPIITAILSIALIFLVKAVQEDWYQAMDDWYPYIFFFVAGMFGFIHIYNYGEGGFEWWMTPFIVIPQFVLGLFLGFVRLRIGLWASILMHAMNNAIPMSLFLIQDNLGF